MYKQIRNVFSSNDNWMFCHISPGIMIILSSLVHHSSKMDNDNPPWSIPGVDSTTIGPGLWMYDLKASSKLVYVCSSNVIWPFLSNQKLHLGAKNGKNEVCVLFIFYYQNLFLFGRQLITWQMIVLYRYDNYIGKCNITLILLFVCWCRKSTHLSKLLMCLKSNMFLSTNVFRIFSLVQVMNIL